MRSISTRFTGLLLVALGVWGGLVPFVGHYFHFALGPDKAWSWTTGRLYLDILPGVATVLGGLNLMSAGPRRSARLGALLALAGGIWFTIGPEISQLWHAGGAQGAGHGSARIQMLEMLTYHTGLGVIVAALAAYALPRFPVVEEAVPATASARRGRGYDEPNALDARESRRERLAAEPGTREHPVAHDAAIGAGAAGAGALAEHHHDKRVAERERHDEQIGAEQPTTVRGASEPDMAPTQAGAETQRAPGVTPAYTEPTDATVADAPADATPAAGRTARPGAYADHQTARRRRGGLLGSLLRR